MAKFNPANYDAKTDSSYGYGHGGARLDHMNDLILEVHGATDGDRICPCGCAESPDRGKAQFRMGHDARLKGKLARAGAANVQVVLTDASRSVREVLSPLEYAIRFNTAKLDWVQYVQAAVNKSVGLPAGLTNIEQAATEAADAVQQHEDAVNDIADAS